MNKQLTELGIQAGLMTGEKEQLFFCRPIAQFDEYSPELEKFAELIVKKCAKIAVAIQCPIEEGISRQTQGHTWDMACIAAAMKIKEHFGVEP